MLTKNFTVFIILITLLATSTEVSAKVKLPAIFCDHMVLQQQTDAPIWGKAEPGSKIKITPSWDKQKYSTSAASDGSWMVKVKTPNAGGPYEVAISDGSLLILKDVMIGEVWVCSGQSNMKMKLSGNRNQPVTGSTEAILKSSNNSIRLFDVGQKKSLEPLDDFTGQWMKCEPENVAGFSATAYFFGRMIQENLDVPVGLICSAWGGTRIEPWIGEKGFDGLDWINLSDKKMKNDKLSQAPTIMYNAMIAPMVNFAIRGVIWYQGEANRKKPKEYEKLLPALVKNWRDEWGIGDFPFYYAQIAPFDYKDVNSAYLRETQLNASSHIANSGMACLMDAGEEKCIHPAKKRLAGERLAYLALARTYGKKGFECTGPVLDKMTIENSKVNLTFKHAENGFTSYGKELVNFKVAGEDKHFYPANARISKLGMITLSSDSVKNPVAVRYAFEDFVVGDLYNTAGFPASSFRSDDWPMEF